MRFKTLLALLGIFIGEVTAVAQDSNPFSSIRRKSKVVTVTDGKYDEFFDQTDVQQIGTVLVNIRTMRIVKLFKNEQDAQLHLDNSANSRFLSIDPLANSYPMLSPYQYASNRPIDGTDLDGKEWAVETKIGKSSSGFEVQTSFTVRVKVENNSQIITDPNVIKKKAEVYKNAIESKFKGEETAVLYGISFKVIYKTDVILDYTAPTPDDGNIGRLVFDDRTSTSTVSTTNTGNITTTTTMVNSTPGDTRGQINDFTTRIGITMDEKIVSDADIASTDVHEGGHSAGLNHPWKLSDIEKSLLPGLNQLNANTAQVPMIKNNFMNSAENPDATYRSNSGDKLLLGQLFAMWKKIAAGSYYTPEELKKPGGPNASPAANGNAH